MSDFLIHFTKGKDLESAYRNLKSIIDQSVVYIGLVQKLGMIRIVFAFLKRLFQALKVDY